MDPTTILLIVLSMALIAVIIYLLPIVKKWAASKGIDVNNALVTTDQIIELLQLLMNETKSLPEDKTAFVNNIVDKIQQAIKITEELYTSGNCTKEERIPKAVDLALEMAATANVTVTEEQRHIVEKAVSMLILMLPN
jgi:ATP phosphoribosyltransferase